TASWQASLMLKRINDTASCCWQTCARRRRPKPVLALPIFMTKTRRPSSSPLPIKPPHRKPPSITSNSHANRGTERKQSTNDCPKLNAKRQRLKRGFPNLPPSIALKSSAPPPGNRICLSGNKSHNHDNRGKKSKKKSSPACVAIVPATG